MFTSSPTFLSLLPYGSTSLFYICCFCILPHSLSFFSQDVSVSLFVCCCVTHFTTLVPWLFLTSWPRFSLILRNISTSNRWIGTRVCTDIHASEAINTPDFVVPWLFLFSCHARHKVWVKCLNSYWMDWHEVWYRHPLLRMNLSNIRAHTSQLSGS